MKPQSSTASKTGNFVGKIASTPVISIGPDGGKIAVVLLDGHFFTEDNTQVMEGILEVTVMKPDVVTMLDAFGEPGMRLSIERWVKYEANRILVE